MNITLILEIIKLSLELALQVTKDMPAEQKAKFWEQHARWQAFWEQVLDKVSVSAMVTGGSGNAAKDVRLT